MAESPSNKGVKKSPKKLILIILAVVVLLGSLAGVYFYFSKNAKTGHAEEKVVEHEQAVEPDVFYELSSPLVVDFPPGGSAKVIKIALVILVQGESNVAVLKKHEPMIRNNLLMTISALGAEKAKTTEGKQELRASMVTEIGKVLEKMAGKNTVKDVYFTEFVMQ